MILPRRLLLFSFVSLWILVLCAGFAVLVNYENAPGAAFAAPNTWPSESRIDRSAKTPTLVLFAHPKCPCTRATMGELERIMSQAHGQVHVVVLFTHLHGFADPGADSDLWRRAAGMPGVRATSDPGGREARLYGAATSGHVVLYDAAGRLLFSGGITGSRGHEGDNAGRKAVVSLLRSGQADRSETFVFGCALTEEHTLCARESCPKM